MKKKSFWMIAIIILAQSFPGMAIDRVEEDEFRFLKHLVGTASYESARLQAGRMQLHWSESEYFDRYRFWEAYAALRSGDLSTAEYLFSRIKDQYRNIYLTKILYLQDQEIVIDDSWSPFMRDYALFFSAVRHFKNKNQAAGLQALGTLSGDNVYAIFGKALAADAADIVRPDPESAWYTVLPGGHFYLSDRPALGWFALTLDAGLWAGTVWCAVNRQYISGTVLGAAAIGHYFSAQQAGQKYYADLLQSEHQKRVETVLARYDFLL